MSKAFVVGTHGPDPEGIRLALAAAVHLCEQEKCSALICVPQKKTAEIGVLNQVIPVAQIKMLLKGQSLKLSKTCTLRLESQHTLPQGAQGVVIALHGSMDMMDMIDDIPGLKAVIMVPWTEAEASAWTSKRHPVVLPIGEIKAKA